MLPVLLSITCLVSIVFAIWALYKSNEAKSAQIQAEWEASSHASVSEAARERLGAVEAHAASMAREAYLEALERAKAVGVEQAAADLNETIRRIRSKNGKN